MIRLKTDMSKNDLKRGIKLPDKITSDLAEDVGFHIGDGYMKKRIDNYFHENPTCFAVRSEVFGPCWNLLDTRRHGVVKTPVSVSPRKVLALPNVPGFKPSMSTHYSDRKFGSSPRRAVILRMIRPILMPATTKP